MSWPARLRFQLSAVSSARADVRAGKSLKLKEKKIRAVGDRCRGSGQWLYNPGMRRSVVALLFPVAACAQALYEIPEGVETRWASPENPLAVKG